MINKNTLPTKKETFTVLGILILFLLLTTISVGLRPEHILMSIVYLLLFFATPATRKLAVGL